MQFAAAAVIVLWPAAGWAQSDSQAYFTPLISQKVAARSELAKVTTEGESALASKGYVKIGTIGTAHPGKKTNAEVTEQQESAILKRATEAGGDLVRLSKEGMLEQETVGTGKYTKFCGQTHDVSNGDGRGGIKVTTFCDSWDRLEYKKTVSLLVSEGTVWRYDPSLGAETAAAREAAWKAWSAKEDRPRTLDAAAFAGDKEAAEMLLAHGADVDAKNQNGETPLNETALSEKGGAAVAELLLDHGADVNAKGGRGCTPLWDAAYGQKELLAELLVAHGADVNAKCYGKTPLQAAGMNMVIYKMLRKHGGHR
jgi:hypothetical protein